MKKKPSPKPPEKKSREKPVSLYPLSFEEAMKKLLKVPPLRESKENNFRQQS